jgi:hypothetical protein
MNPRPKPKTLTGITPDPLPIAVRAFAPPPAKSSNKTAARKQWGKPAPSSDWTLVFDTETTVDAAQRLRIGAYQLRKGDELDEAGLFHDPAALSATELKALKRFADDNGLSPRTVAEFVDDVLFDRAYDLRASIVGFNLPFDISRLAIKHGSLAAKQCAADSPSSCLGIGGGRRSRCATSTPAPR